MYFLSLGVKGLNNKRTVGKERGGGGGRDAIGEDTKKRKGRNEGG